MLGWEEGRRRASPCGIGVAVYPDMAANMDDLGALRAGAALSAAKRAVTYRVEDWNWRRQGGAGGRARRRRP